MNHAIPFPEQNKQPERLPDAPETREPREKIVVDERGMIDIPFLLLTILLFLIGLITMFSASYVAADVADSDTTPLYYFAKQARWGVIGIGIMLAIARFVDYRKFLRPLTTPIFIATVVLLVLVPILGTEENGAKRWINLFGFSFQPSEIAKFTLILCYAHIISLYKEKIRTVEGLVPCFLVLLLLVLLIAVQRHFSCALIFCFVAAVMLFLGGVQLWWFLIIGGILAVGGVLYIFFMDYAGSRVDAWLDPWANASGNGYQIVQSLYAIGSGGLMGLGLGRSRQKYLYLPEVENDYVFPVICEELGLVGALVILILFAMLILRGYYIAIHAKDRFGSLLVSGITTQIAIQTILNIAVVTNLLPSTGISLPFFSAGLSALLMQLAEMGVVLAVSRQCDNNLLS